MKIRSDEFFNVITHFSGFVMSIVGIPFLILANQNSTPYSLFSILFFCFGLLFVYGASTLYHMNINSVNAHKYRVVDHISIFYLITGSYAPVCLITLYDGSGLKIFLLVFIIAVIGTVFKLFKTGKHEKLSLLLYLMMGWLIIIDIKSVFTIIPNYGMLLLVVSGLFYTIGAFFYSRTKVRYSHAIWHLFVLAGSITHYFVVLFYIV